MRSQRLLVLLFSVIPTTLALGTGHYVDLNSSNPVPPYANWGTAATNIQDAVDAAGMGDEIIVTNGTYQYGGGLAGGGILTNRVAVTKPIVVQSVNGPAVTIIRRYQAPATTNGDSAVRCVYLATNAVLSGFTLTSGANLTAGAVQDLGGGGVWYESTKAVVTNCVLSGNSASGFGGGGAYSGTLLS
jgi:hypothetical protein